MGLGIQELRLVGEWLRERRPTSTYLAYMRANHRACLSGTFAFPRWDRRGESGETRPCQVKGNMWDEGARLVVCCTQQLKDETVRSWGGRRDKAGRRARRRHLLGEILNKIIQQNTEAHTSSYRSSGGKTSPVRDSLLASKVRPWGCAHPWRRSAQHRHASNEVRTFPDRMQHVAT